MYLRRYSVLSRIKDLLFKNWTANEFRNVLLLNNIRSCLYRSTTIIFHPPLSRTTPLTLLSQFWRILYWDKVGSLIFTWWNNIRITRDNFSGNVLKLKESFFRHLEKTGDHIIWHLLDFTYGTQRYILYTFLRW